MSALWPYLVIIGCLLYHRPPADGALDGGAQCEKPNISTIDNMDRLSIDKEYYMRGEEVTVRCKSGYYPSSDTMRCDNPPEWTPSNVTCIALCKNPDRTILKMVPDRTFYNIGDRVTVNCRTGYRPFPSAVRCVNRGASTEWDSHPQCTAQCAHPAIPNMLSLSDYKTYYNTFEDITVRCNREYYPSSNKMRCLKPRTSQEWHPPGVTCIAYSTAQCKKPTIEDMESLSIDDEYYNHGEEVSIRCKSGYYPSSDTMRCDFPGTPQEWTPPTVTCIGFTMTDWRVTSSSISARTSCIPECSPSWLFHVRCCLVAIQPFGCEYSSGKSITFNDLQPFSEYRISTTFYVGWTLYDEKSEMIKTLESVPDQPEIVTVPSMEDNTIRWRLSEKSGEITGFRMNISARRDYNASFAVHESMEFSPNVTEYKIPLQYGTNYTTTLRGFTSAGAGKDTTENFETDIGDPLPPPMEKTSDGSLQFHPVLDLNGPIRSYQVIVFRGENGNSTMECVKFKNTPYNSSWTPSHYTAAVLPAETLTAPRTFILGDGQHYNGFHNAPLIPNHNYSVYIRVTSRWNHVEKSSCAFAAFIGGVTGEETNSSFIYVLSLPSLGIIISLLVLKLLALVCLTMVPLTPWKESHPRDNKRRKSEENVSTEYADNLEMYDDAEKTEDEI